ncbi:MAG: hypothetical protein FVQ79_03645 [Planctomycetes bacterium]|nr:hypothetical protein [Planctomycetota bacterium]
MEHKELIKLEQQGKILIGVDRAMARKFYTDIPVSTINEETGEAPYFEKIIVWFAFLSGPIALISSIVLGFFAFKWWGVTCLVLCPVTFLVYSSLSARGDSKSIGITLLLFISVGVHFFGNLNMFWVTLFVCVFLFSLWCIRVLYCSATLLLRCFVIRNRRAFEYLSDYLTIEQI